MIDIKELISNLPEGKKRDYLGQVFIKGVSEYYNQYNIDLEFDLDELVSKNIKQIILKDDIINDLKLFSHDILLKLFYDQNTILSAKTTKEIRSKIINHFNITFDVDQQIVRDYKETSVPVSPLHDFQERIRRKIINLIFNNQKRFLVHMPTGSGKTRTTAEVMLDFIRLSSSKSLLNNKIKILWIAQSSELCYQAYETVKHIFDLKGTEEIILANYFDIYELPKNISEKQAVIFCSIQKLLLHYNDPIWQDIKRNNYLVIVDEAHRSVANQWVRALDYFVSDQSVYLLGLTATPGLGSLDEDKTFLLSTYYHSNKITITDSNYIQLNNPIQKLTHDGYLANINRIDIDSNLKIANGLNLGESGDFIIPKSTLIQLSTNPYRNSSIINIIKENYALNKKILVFTCGIAHNQILKALLIDLNINAETVDESTSNRNMIIDKFKDVDSGLNILLNFGILTTGFDAPKTDVCIIARPLTSIVMYSQMVGRILRGPKNNGNKENTLYTIKDNLDHGDYDNMFNSFNQFYQ
jgi:DNA repair protein RadD